MKIKQSEAEIKTTNFKKSAKNYLDGHNCLLSSRWYEFYRLLIFAPKTRPLQCGKVQQQNKWGFGIDVKITHCRRTVASHMSNCQSYSNSSRHTHTVFENHLKSLIQHCERSEQRI